MSNLDFFLSCDDPRFPHVTAFISKLMLNIPKYVTFNKKLQFNSNSHHDIETLVENHIKNEMQIVFKTNTCRYFVKSKIYKSHQFDNFYLETLSTYRSVAEWVKKPLGLALEAWVENNKFGCPICERPLCLSGGIFTPWADLHCVYCKNVHVEVKSRDSFAMNKILKNKHIDGGSYKWIMSQKKANVRHFIIIVPTCGGYVLSAEIKAVVPSVDSKFCAYYNALPKYASLKSYVKLGKLSTVGYIQPQMITYLDHISHYKVRYLLYVIFSPFATIIQTWWKKVNNT